MGANQSQYFKALREAEAYPGPSLIIAYAPCINHGLRAGMGKPTRRKLAVESGYWHLYRYNPALEEEGKIRSLDSNDPDWSKFRDSSLAKYVYTSLKKQFQPKPMLCSKLQKKMRMALQLVQNAWPTKVGRSNSIVVKLNFNMEKPLFRNEGGFFFIESLRSLRL